MLSEDIPAAYAINTCRGGIIMTEIPQRGELRLGRKLQREGEREGEGWTEESCELRLVHTALVLMDGVLGC